MEAQGQMAEQATNVRLHFPVISQTNGRQTRISIANPDPSASLNVMFTAYLEGGTARAPQPRTVAANRQASFLVSDLFPGVTRGTIIAEGQGGGAMTGFYEIADSFTAPTMLGGAEGIQTPQPTLVFPVIKSSGQSATEIHVFNPNATTISVRVAGFTAVGNRLDPTDIDGQTLDTIMLPPFGTLIVSSSELSPAGDVRLDAAQLDGGYVVVETTDGQTVVGSELTQEPISGQMSVAVLNGLSFPRGCLSSMATPCACQADTSAASPVPSSLRQHTLYATYFEGNPAESILYLVNVSDSPAEVAVSAFSEIGQFRGAFPTTGFVTVAPHQVFQAPVLSLFGFNPSPGYVRIEDQSSSFVGGIINRNAVSGRFATLVPLSPDNPQLTQTATDTFFSRVQLDPPSANPRQTTGMVILNPNNNSIRFRIKMTNSSGQVSQSQVQILAARSTFIAIRQSLSALFPNLNVSNGYAQVLVTTAPGPGMGSRLIPVAVYRSSNIVSAVAQQNKQP
ncbi:MAG: hypothetical protein HY314_12395 [Acidobacteria bacterium]|nr:hypothetical protein [Acidobacteriota bacterium]